MHTSSSRSLFLFLGGDENAIAGGLMRGDDTGEDAIWTRPGDEEGTGELGVGKETGYATCTQIVNMI